MYTLVLILYLAGISDKFVMGATITAVCSFLAVTFLSFVMFSESRDKELVATLRKPRKTAFWFLVVSVLFAVLIPNGNTLVTMVGTHYLLDFANMPVPESGVVVHEAITNKILEYLK